MTSDQAPLPSWPIPMTEQKAHPQILLAPEEDSMIGEDVMAASTTETDQLREQLLRAQRLSSVGTLASSVAHEFNNILTTIINYAKVGLKPACEEAGRLQALEKILKGSQRAAIIVNGMLGFTRNHACQRDVVD